MLNIKELDGLIGQLVKKEKLNGAFGLALAFISEKIKDIPLKF